MVNYRQPVNSLGQAANIGQGNLLERVSILETRKRILVADASEEFRRVFTGALEEESGLVLAAETGDGQETVRLAKELSPDIVVMDFVLARMDGLEVLSELAALPVPFPASVIGMLLLLALLATGLLKIEHIREKADFLLANMAFFFLPAGVSVINYFDVLGRSAVALVLVCLLSTVITFGATALSIRFTLRLLERRKSRV